MPGYPGERKSFPTTHWSLIGRAADCPQEQRDALNHLLTIYLPALHSHLVFKKRVDPHDADDLLQMFVEKKILEQDLMRRADADRGRFRTYLATALDRFVANEFERRMAVKRKADRAGPLPDDHPGRVGGETSSGDVFEIAWARETFGEALRRMRHECAESQRDDIWEVFVSRLCPPVHGNVSRPVEYDELVQRFQYESPAQAANVFVTGIRRFRRTLRRVVADYATSETEIEREIGELIDVLRGVVISFDVRDSDSIGIDVLTNLEQENIEWSREELVVFLASELEKPFESCCGDLDHVPHLPPSPSGPKSSTFSLGDVLRSPDSSVEQLSLAKQYAKRRANDGSVLPQDVPAMIYLAAISSALVHCHERITDLDDPSLLERLHWARSQPWSHPELSGLYETAANLLSE